MKGPERYLQIALYSVALVMALYQLLYTQILIQDPNRHLITHLGFALVVVFLSLLIHKKEKPWRFLIGMLLFLSLVVTGYLMVEAIDILEFRTAIPSTSDLIVGAVVILILIVGNWMIYGNTFTLVSLLAIAYLILGRYLPAPFTVPAISFSRLLMWMSVELGSGKGVYGEILDLSATYLFLFIFFGGVLTAFGGTRFVIGIGKWIGSKLNSGPAMVALFGSTLLGTITGSTVANITVTGSFTIPMMKKGGYTPAQAAAIETVSSSGGQITPPIMGATAFLMAGYANIPYISIVIAALIPALLYFICVFSYVSLTAKKMVIKPSVETVDTKELLLDSIIFILPLGVLVYLLLKGYTLPFVGFWSILTIIVVGLASSALRKNARLDFKDSFDKFIGGIVSGSQVAIICGLLGVIVSAVTSSGLAVKLPLAIESLSNGNLLVALFISAASSVVLGIGMPTPAAYMLVAVGAVPALLNMGVPDLSTHLFCFYFAICSHITPPIAIGCLIASKIAYSNYWETCWESLKAAFPKYVLPFFFIYAPVVLLRPEGGIFTSLMQIIAILLMIFSFQISISKFCFTDLTKIEIIIFFISGVLNMFATCTENEFLFFAGLVLFSVGLIGQRKRKLTALQNGDSEVKKIRTRAKHA